MNDPEPQPAPPAPVPDPATQPAAEPATLVVKFDPEVIDRGGSNPDLETR